MPKTQHLFIKGFSGINNAQSASRIKGPTVGNPENYAECTAISNADITDTLSLKRRTGTTKVYTGTPHSLWANREETEAYLVEGSYLKRVIPGSVTYTTANVRLLTAPSLPMSYTQVNYLIVCSNGIDLFIIENGVASDFTTPTKRFKEAVEAGHILACYKRRLYVAIDNKVYFTDADDIERFDENDDPFVFGKRVTMILPVENGIYVSSDRIDFMGGSSPLDFTLREVSDAVAVENTGIVFDGSLAGVAGNLAVFVTDKGVCIGDDNGNVTNITRGTYSYTPTARRGCAMIKESADCNQYIAVV